MAGPVMGEVLSGQLRRQVALSREMWMERVRRMMHP